MIGMIRTNSTVATAAATAAAVFEDLDQSDSAMWSMIEANRRKRAPGYIELTRPLTQPLQLLRQALKGVGPAWCCKSNAAIVNTRMPPSWSKYCRVFFQDYIVPHSLAICERMKQSRPMSKEYHTARPRVVALLLLLLLLRDGCCCCCCCCVTAAAA